MHHTMTIAGLERHLPLCRVTDDLYIGAFVIFGDAPLTVACAEELLAEGGNQILGHFFCQGRLAPAVRKNSRHPRTPERERRLNEAEKHPDSADFAAAEAAARAVLTPLMP